MVEYPTNDMDHLTADISEALREWVTSLPENEAMSPCLYVSGAEYSPTDILKAVENQTRFGQEFVADLGALHLRMKAKDPLASVTDLIRECVLPTARGAGSSSGV